MHYVKTSDNARLYVKDWGRGRPVVLLHGWPLSADSWDDQALVLAEAGFRVIAYDRRGFGRSSQPWDGYDYDTLADDLAAVIEQTGARDATLVGFSMGGGEVVRYMSRHGGRQVVQCALVSSVVPCLMKRPDHPQGVEPAVFEKMSASLKEDRAKFFGAFFEDFFGVGLLSQPVSDEVLLWARTLAMQASLKATLACADAFARTDFRAELPAVRVPTLLLHGSADKTVPIEASSRLAAAGIAQSLLVEYEGAPHGLLATHKARVAADLLDYLKG